MKNVFLIGDSVRYSTDINCGYGIFLMEEMAGEAYVYSPQDDCRSAEYTLRHLQDWAQELQIDPAEIDVVHWNNGLWDIMRMADGKPLTPVDVYCRSLKRIYCLLQMLFPSAQVIFALTTPVLEGDGQKWRNSDIEAYNRAAEEALRPLGAEIDDLYSVAAAFNEKMYRTEENFDPEGAQALGKAAAEAIRKLK